MADYTNQYKHLQSRPVVKQGLPIRSPSITQEAVKKEPGNTPNMAGTQQYSFPPPPPPPGPPPHHQQQQQQPPQYGYAQPPPPQYQQPRGGGPPRGGRGGMQGGRGDFHATQFPHQQSSYNGPPQGYNGPQNHQQNPAPYIGPQAHPPQPQGPPHNAYGPPQWQNNEQHGPPHHGQPPMAHPQHAPHTPHAAPLAASNYHPNYAPQVYQQQSQQYGPQQPSQQQHQQPPPQFQNPQQFGHQQPHQPPHGGPPQWTGPPLHNPQQQQQQQQQFNARGRGGRGGFTNGRGGNEAPLMGPPIRMGFDNERGDHMAQAGPGFPQPYASHSTPPVPFSQPFNQGYSPHFPQAGQRPPIDPNPYNSQNRGRGGNMNNFRGGRGGRGDFNNQFRGRDNRQFSNSGSRPSDNSHKPAGADANGKKKKKRRTNTLGLTPNGVDHEDSDEEVDDVDEEARLVTLLGPDTPQLPTDLDAWLEERRSRFPTKARREAAAEELRQRIEQGLQVRAKKESSNGVSIKKEEGESKLEKQQRKAEKLRLELEKAERRIQESLSGSKRKRETGDEGDDARGSDGESDDSSESDTDSKPETMSSRNGGSMRMPPAPKAQLQRHCKYFSTGGTCGKKGKCRFVHDQEVRNQALRDKEANGGKMTLAQRLILNDTAKDDLTILKSIKYLKEKGLMSEQLTANASRNDDDDMAVREENGYENNLSYGDS